jgi:uncharacterized membrane protein
MYFPVTSPILALFALFLFAILAFVEVGVLEIAYEKLGMPHRTVLLLLFMMIIGSYVYIPIHKIPVETLIQDRIVTFWGVPYVVPHAAEPHYTVIAINVGGALIPAAICLFLLFTNKVRLSAAAATAVVAAVVYHFSRIVPGVGIAVPTLIPGVLAAGAAYAFNRRQTPIVAYIAGTMGCLLGADIMNLALMPSVMSRK